MSFNHFEGTMLPGLGNLPFLHTFNVRYNRIVGSGDRGLDFIIASLTNNTLLNYLAVDGNRLEGVIPETIRNFSQNYTWKRIISMETYPPRLAM